jgi:protein SCO1/2
VKPLRSVHAAVAALAFALLAAPARGQRAEPRPAELEGVEISPVPGTQVPLDRPFVDETGKAVRLGDYFGANRPVLLNLGYYSCPMLCGLVLNALLDGLKGLSWDPGKEFEVVTISINPKETPQLAKLKKQNYVKAYGRPAANRGWHFLTGREEDIRAVTDSVGFYYRYDEKSGQYAHGAAIFILTPRGVLSRAIRGVQFDPQTLRLSLAEASEGKQGGTIDSLLLWCYHYDEESGRYSFQAMTIMRVAGVAVLVLLAALLLPVWLRRRRTTR